MWKSKISNELLKKTLWDQAESKASSQLLQKVPCQDLLPVAVVEYKEHGIAVV